MKTAHASTRDLAQALKDSAQKTGETSPSVRGADWRTAVVAAVGTGTVTADGITARCVETYFNPAVGDVTVISQSSNGNWIAEGRLATVSTVPWTTAALATGFTHDGNSNGNVQYRTTIVGGTRFMEWRGGLGITYASNSIQNGGDCLAAALPANLRPASLRSLVGPCSASSSSALCLKIDARTEGLLRIVGTTTSTSDTYANPIIRPPWVSLNGLRYSLD